MIVKTLGNAKSPKSIKSTSHKSHACMVLDGQAVSAKLRLKLSKPQLNHKSTQPQPYIILVG